ncbi:MAG TPA: nuclear transport factor 2 family protein [Acidimicrobiales bacterium]|nr:nuclear transport factor 2 family protein [Acidimicrobiales bacterium]
MSQPTDADARARAEIIQLAVDERWARDTGQWELMHASYHDDAHVRVGWFNGNAHDFIEGSRAMTPPGEKWSSAFHVIGPTSVTMAGDRALADTGCTVHRRDLVGDVEIDHVLYVRHRSMVERDGVGAWKLRSLRACYQRDTVTPVIPGEAIPIDKGRLPAYRASYKLMSYLSDVAGRLVDQTLPGTDRPDLIDELIAEEEAWLAGGTWTPRLPSGEAAAQ